MVSTTWSRLDDLYDDHPKVLAAMHMNPLAVALHVTAITASSRRESDGLVDPFWLLARVPDRKRREGVLGVLTELALYDVLAVDLEHEFTDAAGFAVRLGPFAGERYIVHDYLDFNPSSAQLQDRRRRDAERKAGGRRKESDESPDGVRVDTRRTPRGPRGRAGAPPHPIPSHPIPEPPLAPPADAEGEPGQPGDASSPVRRNSRALGTSPRDQDAAILADRSAAAATAAARSLAPAGDDDREGWKRYRAALERSSPEGTYAQWLKPLRLIAVDRGVLVIDHPDGLDWIKGRFGRVLDRVAEHADVGVRLATEAEHKGFAVRAVTS